MHPEGSGVKKLSIDHIGIAVESLDEGKAFYEALGLQMEGIEEVSEQKVRVGFLPIGDTRLELLEPTSPESPIGRHLSKRGAGLHHLCFQVEDIEASMEQLQAAGYRLLSTEPQPGAHGCRVCFVHPKSSAGVLIELSEKA